MSAYSYLKSAVLVLILYTCLIQWAGPIDVHQIVSVYLRLNYRFAGDPKRIFVFDFDLHQRYRLCVKTWWTVVVISERILRCWLFEIFCYRVHKQVVNVPSFLVRLDSQKHIDFSLKSPFGSGRPGRVKRKNLRKAQGKNQEAAEEDED